MQRAVVYFLFCALVSVTWEKPPPRTEQLLINFVRVNMEVMNSDFRKTDVIRQMSRMSAGYEIGFIIRNMEECYRRMVDIYNSSLTTDLGNYQAQTTDYIMFLKHVEMLHWALDHFANMVHEVEKKYKIKRAGMFESHDDFKKHVPSTTKRRRSPSAHTVTTTTTTRRPPQSWWPIDYGWEVNYEWR